CRGHAGSVEEAVNCRTSKFNNAWEEVMKINRRQFVGGALGATALSALPLPAIGQSGPIRIGCVTSLVGGYSLFGEAHARGMQIAAEMINADGGINGRQIEII